MVLRFFSTCALLSRGLHIRFLVGWRVSFLRLNSRFWCGFLVRLLVEMPFTFLTLINGIPGTVRMGLLIGFGVSLLLLVHGICGCSLVRFLDGLNIFFLIFVNGIRCYTLNTTGSEFGYGPGRKVSETRHTVLGRHTETGQPTASGLGSSQPTLRHQEVSGPSTGADRESASAVAEEVNLGGHHKKDKQSEGNWNARSGESRSRNRSGVVSRGTAQRNNTTSRESLYRCRRPEARGDTAAPRCQET